MSNPNTDDPDGDSDSWKPGWWTAAGALFSGLMAVVGSDAEEVGRAIALIVDDPIKFIREFILEGLLILGVRYILNAVEQLLQGLAQSFVAAGEALWAGTFGVGISLTESFSSEVVAPLIELTRTTTENLLVSMGVAAPIAALIAIGVTVIVTIAVLVVLWELAATYLPLRAISRPLRGLLAAAGDRIGAAFATVRSLPARVFGSSDSDSGSTGDTT